jgi:hypothetical protein
MAKTQWAIAFKEYLQFIDCQKMLKRWGSGEKLFNQPRLAEETMKASK